MRKFLLVLFLASTFSWAQMNYVALVKDVDGVPVSNSNVDVRISIVDFDNESIVYYSESHNTSTTVDGIVRLSIGEGNVISGDFQMIDWSKKLAIVDAYDLDGNGYTIGGKELIRSVPIAKYAEYTSINSSTFIDGPGDIVVGSEPLKYSQGYVDLFDIVPGLSGDNILIGKNIFKTKTVSDTDYNPTGNIAIGNNALTNSKSGANIAIGTYSQSESEGGNNIGVGVNTLKVSKGYDNIAIGSRAFDELETGNGNIGIGKEVGFNFYGGANNVGIGHRAFGGNYSQANTVTNTTFNTGVGYGSGYDLVGNNNTALGRESGKRVNGNLNTFLGSYATSEDGTDINNSTAIGANAVVTTSNTIQLGDSNVDLINTSATVSASAFVGDGSKLTGIFSGTDSQTLFATLENTQLQFKMENTSTTETIDLNSIVDEEKLFNNAILITTDELYTVPPNYTAKIVSILPSVGVNQNYFSVNGTWEGGSRSSHDYQYDFEINGETIIIGRNYRTGYSDSENLHQLDTYNIMIDNEYYLPEGTTIQKGENIGLINIVLIEKTLKPAKIISNSATVPDGKVWIVKGFFNNQTLSYGAGGDNDWSITINGIEIFLAGIEEINRFTYGEVWVHDSKFMYSGQLVLPAGTSISLSDNLHGISVIEQ